MLPTVRQLAQDTRHTTSDLGLAQQVHTLSQVCTQSVLVKNRRHQALQEHLGQTNTANQQLAADPRVF